MLALTQRQVNIRLDDTDIEFLESLAFVNRRSLPDELRIAVRTHLKEHEGHPGAIQALASRTPPKETRDETSVSSLDAKRKKAQGSSA